jgi:hypothetical protein
MAGAAGGYLYHPIHGKSGFMWNADMTNPKIGALALHPDEWKDRPWTDAEIEAYKRKQGAAEVKAEPQEPTPAPAPRKRGRPFTKKEPQSVAAE